jgi:hypothetical protein
VVLKKWRVNERATFESAVLFKNWRLCQNATFEGLALQKPDAQ